MSSYAEAKILVDELFSDGKIHSIKEVRVMLAEHGIVDKKNGNMISNVLYDLKRKGIIKMCETKGDYIWAKSPIKQKLEERKDTHSNEPESTKTMESPALKPNINMDNYIIIRPQKPRQAELKVTIIEAGEIRLNSALYNRIKNKRIAVYLSKDMRNMILCPNGEAAMEFTKAGTAKNREIVNILKEKRIPFPVSYIVKWNDEYGAWEGTLNISIKK